MTGAVLLNIGDMIDLAIGTPEVGVVDFNMLQTVLHCLAQQLRVQTKNVEVRGSFFTLPVVRENVQTIAIKEYLVDTDDKSPDKTKKIEKQTADLRSEVASLHPEDSRKETILVVERVRKSDLPGTIASSPPRRAHSPLPHVSPSSESARPVYQTHATPSRLTSNEKLSLVTLSKFNFLENTVEDLKNRVYGSMPKNEAILEEVRSQTNLKAITDMWTSLNVSSRLEAAEAGIAKLSSLVQDVINETAQLPEALRKGSGTQRAALMPAPMAMEALSTASAATPAIASAIGPATASSSGPATASATGPATASASGPAAASATGPANASAAAPVSTLPTSATSAVPPTQPLAAAYGVLPGASKEELASLQALVSRMRADLNFLSTTFYKTMQEIQRLIGKPIPLPRPPPCLTEMPTAAGSSTTVEIISMEETTGETGTAAVPGAKAVAITTAAPGMTAAAEATAAAAWSPSSDDRHRVGTVTPTTTDLMKRINELEKKLKKCCDNIGKNDGVIHDQMNSFQNQLEYLMKQQSTLQQNLTGGSLSPDLIKDLQGLMALFKTVQDMQGQLKEVHETALHLASEKEDRQGNMNALLEQIELLKTIKLDREDMLEAMAEKADLRMLARKVSHDQFELACDDLSRGLEHAVGKLNVQEALWQQALDDIQREIETKLDKMELSPVKDFFNGKLRQLQDNLKQMALLRREAEAAGTKHRLLRDVNCISCDANAVMKMDAQSNIPVSKPLPATHSMKPYLSYELDAIRKTQASNLPQRNMHDWENIDKQISSKPSYKARSDIDKHICNRYCGGSHTVTTPAQRVARLGHFIKQWGPEVLPLSSGLAAGDDGRMYKVSPIGEKVNSDNAEAATCTPQPVPVKPELPKSQKPLNVSADCHCLDEA